MGRHRLKSIYYFIGFLIATVTSWAPDPEPEFKVPIDQDEFIEFKANSTNHFKILDQDENTILIGARNAAYNISLKGLKNNIYQGITWSSSDADRELCALKGKLEQDCQNYIRLFAKLNENQIMLCGTNSYKPRCRYYNVQRNDAGEAHEKYNEIEAQGRCPYNPQHNSTYVFTDGQLYSATVADFSGADPLIYRKSQRTEQYDLKQLNQPAFVSAVERNGYVFFFFREIAMEHMNCGKAIYSRVARVCKNDKGGPHAFADRWTSFLKARLNCSVPGEYPFYFDEIQGTSKIIDGIYNGNKSSIVYAVFTTSINAIPGSAVCAYAIDDILDAFEGRFKAQNSSFSNWLPLPVELVPDPRPGQCVDDSRTLSSTTVNFVKTHTLMEAAVPAFYGKPLLTKVSTQYRFTAVTVDSQVLGLDRNTYDVIFVGTDDGKVIKFVNLQFPEKPGEITTKVLSEFQVLPLGTPIREMTVSHKTESLIVVGDDHIVSVPLYQCSKIRYCHKCMRLKDPYCAWDVKNFECVPISNTKAQTQLDSFIQNLIPGQDSVPSACSRFGDSGNSVEQPKRKVVVQSTRGTVASVGKMPKNNYEDNYVIATAEDDDEDNSKDTINDPLIREELGVEEGLRLASNNIYWGFAGIVLIVVFGIGILVGLYASKRLCKTSPFHAEHRNQLSSKTRPMTRNSGKDVNLLMNTNPFPTIPCNNKKDNLEHEFVGTKDRSHEFKNSTENLEKGVHCKPSTLTKVKRTYI